MLKLCNNIMSQPLYKYLVMTKNSKILKSDLAGSNNQNPAKVPIWKIRNDTTYAVTIVMAHIVIAHLKLLVSFLIAAMAAIHGV